MAILVKRTTLFDECYSHRLKEKRIERSIRIHKGSNNSLKIMKSYFTNHLKLKVKKKKK